MYLTSFSLRIYINPLGSRNTDTRFVADFPDKDEKSLNYSAIFDRTDKSNTPFESVRGLLLFVYTHNKN